MNSDTVQRFMDLHYKMKATRFTGLDNTFVHSEFVTLFEISQLAKEKSGKENIVGVGISMNKIAKKLSVSPAMISKTIRNLENRKIVERYIDTVDRRVIKVCLTEEGFQKFSKIKRDFKDFIFEALDEMGDDDLNKLIELNERLHNIVTVKLEKKKQIIRQKGDLEHGQNT